MPFAAGRDEPANPFLQTVMRRPLSAAERPIPVGVVSHTYSLAFHRDVAALCRKGIVGRGIDLFESGIDAGELRYEVGLSELVEWMIFRIYLPDQYSFTDADGQTLDLRLECFNSVDGSSRVVIFDRLAMGLDNSMTLAKLTPEHRVFLAWRRAHLLTAAASRSVDG